MFEKRHETKIQSVLRTNINNILEERIENLKEDYQKNEFIDSAEIRRGENDKIDIKLNLTFEPLEAEEQNIPAVFEYGGVLFRQGEDGGRKIVEIEPGFYIRRNLAHG